MPVYERGRGPGEFAVEQQRRGLDHVSPAKFPVAAWSELGPHKISLVGEQKKGGSVERAGRKLVFGLQIMLPNHLSVTGVQAMQGGEHAEGIDPPTVNDWRGAGAACLFRHKKPVGRGGVVLRGPNLISRPGIETENPFVDDRLLRDQIGQIQLSVDEDGAGIAEADGNFPGRNQACGREGGGDARFGPDPVPVGAAPLRPIGGRALRGRSEKPESQGREEELRSGHEREATCRHEASKTPQETPGPIGVARETVAGEPGLGGRRPYRARAREPELGRIQTTGLISGGRVPRPD